MQQGVFPQKGRGGAFLNSFLPVPTKSCLSTFSFKCCWKVNEIMQSKKVFRTAGHCFTAVV